ncbi:MAG: tRNA (N6-threonylcarbamoyladenosine(37)-N6)-methyltransferase TrmO [Pseudomonadota bacterium]
MGNHNDPVIELTAIGRINTGFMTLDQCPGSGRFNEGTSTIELKSEFAQGLHNIQMASHAIVLYWFDKANRNSLMRKTKPGEAQRGVFASRSPGRPNPVAVSVVRIIKHDGSTLTVSGLDCLDGSSVIDIKPYCPEEDRMDDARIGWTFP